MRIEKILKGIKDSQEKTAAEKEPVAVTSEKTASTSASVPAEALKSALTAALSSEKTASTANPVNDVVKIANEVAASEKEAALKEAQLLGAAFADAAVARLQEWQKVAAQMPAAPAPQVNSFGKFASENGQLVNEAAQLGYQVTKEALEKQSAVDYEQGYNETVELIHKLAADEFAKAAALTNQILHAASQENA